MFVTIAEIGVASAGEEELRVEGFRIGPAVVVKTLNIDFQDPRGPFCRLLVTGPVPESPGVYSWCRNGRAMYVGMSGKLWQIVQGYGNSRANNDYTYVARSQLRDLASPRVRVNGLMNRAICEGAEMTWWWLSLASVEQAKQFEARLIYEWNPPWNVFGR